MKKVLEESVRLLCNKFDVPIFNRDDNRGLSFWKPILNHKYATAAYLLRGMKQFENRSTHSRHVHLRI